MDRIEKLCTDNGIEYLKNEEMKKHTSFKIGGACDLFICVNDMSQLKKVIDVSKEESVPYMIIGNGSNLLVHDEGIDGAVIRLRGKFLNITKTDDTHIRAGAGAKLADLCIFAKNNSLSGLEFAYGIPGSVGGAVFMNAGAYGGETKDVIVSVTYLRDDGEICTYTKDELELSYRTSVFKKTGEIILFADYELDLGNTDDITEKMSDIMNRRKTKQPLEYPSAGSVFKRPQGQFAGTLIQQCGLKGKSIGGAAVSEKHAGFIINTGGATCSDVLALVKLVQDTVKENTGFFLEREIIDIGK